MSDTQPKIALKEMESFLSILDDMPSCGALLGSIDWPHNQIRRRRENLPINMNYAAKSPASYLRRVALVSSATIISEKDTNCQKTTGIVYSYIRDYTEAGIVMKTCLANILYWYWLLC